MSSFRNLSLLGGESWALLFLQTLRAIGGLLGSDPISIVG
jgi:hypothetical protein